MNWKPAITIAAAAALAACGSGKPAPVVQAPIATPVAPASPAVPAPVRVTPASGLWLGQATGTDRAGNAVQPNFYVSFDGLLNEVNAGFDWIGQPEAERYQAFEFTELELAADGTFAHSGGNDTACPCSIEGAFAGGRGGVSGTASSRQVSLRFRAPF